MENMTQKPFLWPISLLGLEGGSYWLQCATWACVSSSSTNEFPIPLLLYSVYYKTQTGTTQIAQTKEEGRPVGCD